MIGRMRPSKLDCCRKGRRRLPVGLAYDLNHRACSTRLLCCCAGYGWFLATLARRIRAESVAKEGFLMLWAQRARISGSRQGTTLSITRELSA
jgi:hypothetical protein